MAERCDADLCFAGSVSNKIARGDFNFLNIIYIYVYVYGRGQYKRFEIFQWTNYHRGGRRHRDREEEVTECVR